VPSAPLPYFKLIGSLWTMSLTTPVLRRRAACHAGLALLYWLGEYAGHVTARGKTA
jgi:hypothetical protein